MGGVDPPTAALMEAAPGQHQELVLIGRMVFAQVRFYLEDSNEQVHCVPVVGTSTFCPNLPGMFILSLK